MHLKRRFFVISEWFVRNRIFFAIHESNIKFFWFCMDATVFGSSRFKLFSSYRDATDRFSVITIEFFKKIYFLLWILYSYLRISIVGKHNLNINVDNFLNLEKRQHLPHYWSGFKCKCALQSLREWFLNWITLTLPL